MRGAHGRTRRGPRGSVCRGLRLPRVFVCLTASHRPTERAPGRESRRAAGEGAAARPRGRGSGPSRPVFDTRLLPGSGGRRREGAQQTCSWPGLRCAPAPSVIPWSPGFPSARGLLAQGDASNAPHTQEPLHSALTADRRFGRLQKNRSSVLEMRPNSIFFQNSYQELQCNFDF